MGDRFVKQRGPAELGARLMARRGKPPPTLLAWGLGSVSVIGHNNGPPLDDPEPGYLWRRHRWTAAHREVWKTPPLPILRLRVARAEAAGLTYDQYMSALLDTGRCTQPRDLDQARTAALSVFRAAWNETMARIVPQSPRINRGIVLSSLIACYDSDTRPYHGLVHIADMLRDLANVQDSVDDRDAMVLAILFHDAIYDATAKDSEARSAELAALHLGDLGAASAFVKRVKDLILATRHTEAPPPDRDTALLLDLDLAILAAEPMRYARYADAIRREYAHVPDDAYAAGRPRVLASFLARPRIYQTAQFAHLEPRARVNVTAEIDGLTGTR